MDLGPQDPPQLKLVVLMHFDAKQLAPVELSFQAGAMQRYEVGKLKSDRSNPSVHSLACDLVASLGPYHARRS